MLNRMYQIRDGEKSRQFCFIPDYCAHKSASNRIDGGGKNQMMNICNESEVNLKYYFPGKQIK